MAGGEVCLTGWGGGGGGGCQWGRRQDVRLGRDGERGSVRKCICNLIGLFLYPCGTLESICLLKNLVCQNVSPMFKSNQIHLSFIKTINQLT